jgi:putative ABC transport system substrate-binding protein
MGMRRREFIGLIGCAAAWPLAARAQEPGRVYRLAFFSPSLRSSAAVAAMLEELRIHGFVLGQNLEVLSEGFGVSGSQAGELAASLVKASPDVIVTASEPYLRDLQQNTRSIAIIGMTEDMVTEGFAVTLARPGSNITGLSLLSPELDGKRLEILIEAVPGAAKIAVLAESRVTPQRHIDELQEAARGRGVSLLVTSVASRDEVLPAIENLKKSGAQAVNFLAGPLFSINSGAFIQRVTELRLPSIFQWAENAEEGALVAYGPRLTEMYRDRTQMVMKVLRGAKPVDIPVEQPSKFELVINLNTAKAIGLEIPAGLLLRADKLIE